MEEIDYLHAVRCVVKKTLKDTTESDLDLFITQLKVIVDMYGEPAVYDAMEGFSYSYELPDPEITAQFAVNTKQP